MLQGFGKHLVLCLAWVAVACLAAGAQAQQVLMSDNFDSLPEGAHPSQDVWAISGSDDPAFWFNEGGAISSGNLDDFLPVYSYLFVMTPSSRSWTNIRVGADFEMRQQDGAVALALRVGDFANYYQAALSTGEAPNGGRFRTVEITKWVNGVPLDIEVKGGPNQGTAGLPAFEDGAMHRFEFQADGPRLTVFLDGRALLAANDTQFRFGSAGIGGKLTHVIFDNVTVTTASDAAGGAVIGGGGGPGATASGDYRLLIASGLTSGDAEEHRSFLAEKHPSVIVAPWEGRFAVFLGRYNSESAALEARRTLDTQEGIDVEDVRLLSDDMLASLSGTSTRGNFRIEVGRFSDRTAAMALQTDLSTRGIYPVNVVQESGVWKVYAGFAAVTRQEAERVGNDLRSRGVTGFTIVELGAAAASATPISVQPTPRPSIDAAGYRSRIDAARNAEDFDQALTIVNEWLSKDPNNNEISRLRGELETQRSLWLGQKSAREREAREIAGLMAQAEQAYSGGDKDSARDYYRQVVARSTDELVKNDANRKISEITREILSDPESAPASTGGDSNVLLIGIVIIIGFAAVGLGVYYMSRKSGGKPVPASAPVISAPAAAGTVAAGGVAAAPKPKRPAKEADRIVPGAISPAPPNGDAVTTQVAKPGSAVPVKEKAKQPAPKAGASKPVAEVAPPESETLDLGDLGFGDDFEAALGSDPPAEVAATVEPPPAAAPVPQSDSQRLATGDQQSSVFAMPPMPDSSPHLFEAQGTAPAVASGAQLGQGIFYQQNFEDEEIGKLPSNWKGSYDYASLTVVQRDDSTNGSTKCMQFEKKSGSGSAYYSCRFPDASGRIGVEFDLRCIDKNKYLLGFYIEKDEDFRHSVHTVVHRDTSRSDRVALRLQNEAHPYKLGDWVHVRFQVDLQRHLVDGYVDDKPVAVGVRLLSRPKVVNTLSIRDNLATEGIILIDNIRIYRDR